MRTPMLVAHRGEEYLAPEHTFSSYDLCRDAGIEYLELDVRQSKDGRLFSFHDEDVMRITGDPDRFCTLDSESIRALDAGSWFSSAFAGERIPMLEEIFDRYAKSMAFFFDVKEGTDEDVLVELIRQQSITGSSFFWFSDHRQRDRFRYIYPDFRIKENCSTVDDLSTLQMSMTPDIVECPPEACSGPLGRYCVRHGIELMTSLHECSHDQVGHMISCNVTYINTARPLECKETVDGILTAAGLK